MSQSKSNNRKSLVREENTINNSIQPGKARKLNNQEKVKAKLESIRQGDRRKARSNHHGSMSSHGTRSERIASSVQSQQNIESGLKSAEPENQAESDIPFDEQENGDRLDFILNESISNDQENNSDEIKRISTTIRSIERRMKNIESAISDKNGSTSDALLIIIHSMMSLIHPSQPSVNKDVLLSPIARIFCGKFYSSMFTHTVINVTMNILKRHNCFEGNEISEIVLYDFCCFLNGILYSSGKGGKKDIMREMNPDWEKLDKEENLKFRKKLTYVLIKTAQNNKSIGCGLITLGESMVKVSKPFWLHPSYITDQDINEISDETEKVSNKKHEKRNEHDNQIDLNEDFLNKQELVKNILKRVNDVHVCALNRMRERIRTELLIQYTYIFDEQEKITIEEVPNEEMECKVNDIPTVNVKQLRSFERKKACKHLWEKAMKECKNDMNFKISYEVYLSEENEADSSDRGKKSIVYSTSATRLTRYVNTMTVALNFLLRLTGSHGFYEYIGSHRHSILLVYAVACLFRQQLFAAAKIDQTSSSITPEQSSYMNNQIRVIQPQLEETRRRLIKTHIRMLPKEKFYEINLNGEKPEEAVPVEEEKNFNVEEFKDLEEAVKELVTADF